jgi:hypothetical protein
MSGTMLVLALVVIVAAIVVVGFLDVRGII